MKRSDAREVAFLYLYQRTVRADAMEELFSAASEAENEELRLNGFARRLVLLCDEKITELDAVIERHLDRWKLNRLPNLTLAALRLAVCELLFDAQIPSAVTIDETVQLLKKYASPEDAAFANGVLGAVVRDEPVAEPASPAAGTDIDDDDAAPAAEPKE